MQLPAIVLTLAENQRLVAEHLSKQRLAVSLGDSRSLSPPTLALSIAQLLQDREKRTEMGALGRATVDGEGARRVVKQLRQSALRLRRVSENDSRLLWEWANDPDVRAVSFSTTQIPWDDHVRWFRGKLDDPRCFFYLALDGEGLPVGQIRFDINAERATISVSMERNSRGLGYGSRVIELASRQLFADAPVQSIVAYVKADNHASARAFVKAGYAQTDEEDAGGQRALQFVMQRGNLERLH
jgi:RimJ/RimL family protein N-acetyltransferase